MRIMIAGDLVPTESNEKLFLEGNVEELVGKELVNKMMLADFRICNLETPLCTGSEMRIQKYGPNLWAKMETIKGICKLKINLVTLANNHIMDYGKNGLNRTVETLAKAGIGYLGVGNNLLDASKPYQFESMGEKVGVYACTEHEFSVALEDEPGANPFDPYKSNKDIADLKESNDLVIVLYHGGKEFYRYPSPELQQRCRVFVDSGADLVVCQHSHCIGCEEKYKNGVIVYGQGNFVFDRGDNEFWNEGLLIQLDYAKEKMEVEYIPVVKENGKIRIASMEKRSRIIDMFWERSCQIKEEGFVKQNYLKFAQEKYIDYMAALGGKESVLFKVVNKLSFNKLRKMRIKKKYDSNQKNMIINYLECEAHRELLCEALKGSEW